MPLVTSTAIVFGDNGGGHWGPHWTAAGNLFVFGRFGADARYIRPHRSVDGGANWTERTPRNFGSNVNAFWSEVDAAGGDVIHCAAHLDSGALVYVPYTTSTDTWGTAETIHSNVHGAADGFGVNLRQHPMTGRLWILFQGDGEDVFGINRRRIYLTERTAANTYTTPASLHGDGQNIYVTVGDLVFEPSGELHLFFGTWQPRVFHRTHNGTALSATEEVSDTAAPFAVNAARRMAHYSTSGTSRVTFCWRGAGGGPYASHADNGAPPAPEAAVSSDAAAVWDSDNSAAIVLAADGSDRAAYLFWADAASGDLYESHSQDGGAWSSPAAIVTGVTVRALDVTVYVNDSDEVVAGLVYDEDGVGVSYVEHVLRSLVAPTLTVNVSAAALTATAGTAGIENLAGGTSVVIHVLPGGLHAAAGPALPDGAAVTVDVDVAALVLAGRRASARLAEPAYGWEFRVDWDGDGVYEADEAFRLVDLKVRRGRQEELAAPGGGFNPYRPGQCIATLANADGRYDAWNTASPLYPNVLPARRCYLTVSYGTWSARVFTGVIDDLAPIGRHDRVQVTIAEPPAIFAAGVPLPVITGATVNDLVALLTAGAGAAAVRVGHSMDVIPYWWPTAETYMGCLQDLAAVLGDDVFIDAHGRVQYLVHGWGDVETWALDEAQILKEFEISQPWHSLRNRVAVASARRARGATAVLWTLADTPALAQGDTFETEAIFSDARGQVPALDVLTPVAGVDYQANTAADGSGVDVTSRFTATLEAYGTRGVVRVTYSGTGGPAYLTHLQVRGDPLSAADQQTVVRRDAVSSAAYGDRSLALDSALVQSYGTALPLAEMLLGRYGAPQLNPTVRLESRGEPVQFAVELGRKLTLILPSMGIEANVRLAGLMHEWQRDTGQSVVTTYWLAPWVDYSGYWHFPATLGSTSRLGG